MIAIRGRRLLFATCVLVGGLLSAPTPAEGLCRPRRRLRLRLPDLHPPVHNGHGRDDAAELADPRGSAEGSRQPGAVGEPGDARDRAGARRAGSGADRAADGQRRAAQLRQAAPARQLSSAADHASRRVAGRLDVVPDWLQPRQAPDLRLPDTEPEVTSAGPLLGAGGAAQTVAAPGTVPHPPRHTADRKRDDAASPSGRSLATTASSARSCGCRSRSRPRNSTAPCSRR